MSFFFFLFVVIAELLLLLLLLVVVVVAAAVSMLGFCKNMDRETRHLGLGLQKLLLPTIYLYLCPERQNEVMISGD